MPTRLKTPSIRRRYELPPTPPIPAVLQTLACRWMPLAYFEFCRARYGERFTIYPVGKPPVVFLSNPQEVQETLNASPRVLHPGAGAATIAPIVGDTSFMLCDEDEHMRRRKTITAAFTHAAVQAHTAAIEALVQREIAQWPLDTPIPIHRYLRDLTLRVALFVVFGECEPALQDLHAHILKMLDVTESFVVTEPKLRHLPGWRHTWRGFATERARADAVMLDIIRSRRGRPGTHGCVLDMLLAARTPDGSPPPDRLIRNDAMSVILAGHETTAATLAWAFQLLAHNPRVRERLIDELDNGTGDAYLTATVHEILRHRPVFLFAIPRAVVHPIEIGGRAYHPPAQLLACIHLVHHDPQLHHNPREFQPERFLQNPPAPHTWFPWGGGRKRCPGHRLATVELRTILRATLATRTVLPARSRIGRARWRAVIVAPRAGLRVVLASRGKHTRVRPLDLQTGRNP
ncbi:MAG TPA: cytochrome P450 [Solirubrobacteraceae bacterium]|jgi:cytochrome P450|nr:cytochrome P450 [Solirubrobacteraceae bacterium]